MPDNITLNAGSGGAIVRTLVDAGGVEWPVSVVCYAGALGTPNILVPVTASSPLPVALGAGTALVGQASASHETGTVYNGTTALTPKFANFTITATGAVVAAVAGRKIRVLRWRASANAVLTFNLQSHATAAKATGLSYAAQYKDFGGGYCPLGIMETAAGEALDGVIVGTGTVSGELTYVEV